MSNKNAPEQRNDLGLLAQVEEGYVLLPFSEGQFRDFIKTLLGSPQAYSRRFSGEFEIDASEIRNLHHMLFQRLEQQNDSTLIYFRARVDYSDNSSVEHDSIESLLTYNEVRPVISTQLHMTWDFLVRFADRSVPEKQRIQLSVDTGNLFMDSFSLLNEDQRQSRIELRIEHTARTWAADIEALLTGHLHTIVHAPSRWVLVVRKYGVYGTALVVGLCAILTIFVDIVAADKAENRLIKTIGGTIRAINTPNEKIDYLADLIVNERVKPFGGGGAGFVAFMTILILGLGSIFLFNSSARKGDPGFLLLTRESLRNRDRVKQALRRRWLSNLLSFILAIVVGVIGNLVYALYFAPGR